MATVDIGGSPVISFQRATNAVRADFAFVKDGTPVSATLALETTGQFGKELESDLSKPSRIQPSLARTPVWVLTFSNVPVPIMNQSNDSTLPDTASSDFVAFVDVTSGAVPYALGF